jgi:hypothetical protein
MSGRACACERDPDAFHRVIRVCGPCLDEQAEAMSPRPCGGVHPPGLFAATCCQSCGFIETSPDLTACFSNGWNVRDDGGGRWWPGAEARELIASAADPAAMAVELCERRPMLGDWHS